MCKVSGPVLLALLSVWSPSLICADEGAKAALKLKEPKYKASPAYAVLALDPAGTRLVTVVLDGRELVVDRNANADLTEPDERLTLFKTGYDDDQLHFETTIKIAPGAEQLLRIWVGPDESGRHGIKKLYFSPNEELGQSSCGFVPFAAAAKDAHRIPFRGRLTLALIDWDGKPRKGFKLNEQERSFSVLIGTWVPGLEGKAFVAYRPDYKKLLGGAGPRVEFAYPTNRPSEPEARVQPEISLCDCNLRYWAKVRVLPHAVKGKVKVTMSFPSWKDGNVAPATAEIPID